MVSTDDSSVFIQMTDNGLYVFHLSESYVMQDSQGSFFLLFPSNKLMYHPNSVPNSWLGGNMSVLLRVNYNCKVSQLSTVINTRQQKRVVVGSCYNWNVFHIVNQWY